MPPHEIWHINNIVCNMMAGDFTRIRSVVISVFEGKNFDPSNSIQDLTVVANGTTMMESNLLDSNIGIIKSGAEGKEISLVANVFYAGSTYGREVILSASVSLSVEPK